MPEAAAKAWRLPQELVDANYKRLGNMCLLKPKTNSLIGTMTYTEKLIFYKDSTFTTTQDVLKFSQTHWHVPEIDARQIALAKLAPKIWKL
jgi:hypothetical protein